LAGWAYTNDVEKMRRWQETVAWAIANGCPALAANIPETDFRCVAGLTDYVVGPGGGPMYHAWDFKAKTRPGATQIAQAMEVLSARWPEIVGEALAGVTRPLAFTGKKLRRLIVFGDGAATPPWGSWTQLSAEEPKRRAFTAFRAAINKAIAPLEVDHVEFTPKNLR